MKRLIEDTKELGMEALLGERITIFGMNYFYTGVLTGVNSTHIELQDAAVVYETGSYDTAEWKDAQPLPHKWHIQLTAIESWGILK